MTANREIRPVSSGAAMNGSGSRRPPGTDTANQALTRQSVQAAAVAKLAPRLQAATRYEVLGQVFFSGLADFIDLGQGSLYLADDLQQRLKLGYGYARSDAGLPVSIAYGTGLAGQCAIERQPIFIEETSPGYLEVGSILMSGKPASILILPIINHDILLGILELASLQPFSDDDRALIDSLAPVLALCMEIIARNEQTQKLLTATQEQARALEVKQAETLEAKARSEAASARFSTLFNTSTTAHVIIDSQARIVDCNTAFLHLLDYPSLDKVHGKHPAALAPEYQPNGRSSMACGVENVGIAIERGRHTFEWWCADAHGQSIPVEVTIVPVMMDGQPHLMGIWHDLRSRFEIEDKLRKAMEIAEDAAKTKSDFLANMSHEIRTPMNAIIGMAHLALKTDLTPRQRDYIKKIQNSGQHLLGIINDKVAYTVRRIAELARRTFAVKNLTVAVATPHGVEDDQLMALGDPMLCYSLFQNLIKNACEAAPDNTAVTITLYTGDPMRITLDNKGTVPAAIRDNFFEKFATAGKQGGTGLGTYSAKMLVEAQNGTIAMETSDEKNQTRITLTLPAE